MEVALGGRGRPVSPQSPRARSLFPSPLLLTERVQSRLGEGRATADAPGSVDVTELDTGSLQMSSLRGGLRLARPGRPLQADVRKCISLLSHVEPLQGVA